MSPSGQKSRALRSPCSFVVRSLRRRGLGVDYLQLLDWFELLDEQLATLARSGAASDAVTVWRCGVRPGVARVLNVQSRGDVLAVADGLRTLGSAVETVRRRLSR